MAHAEIDRLTQINLLGNVMQHAVSEINRVVKSHESEWCLVLGGMVFKQALAGEAGSSVFAGWGERAVLGGATAIHRNQRIHTAGGERHNAGGTITISGERGHESVHGPGKTGVCLGAEFLADEVDDVFTIGQLRPLIGIKQIRGLGLHAVVFQPVSGTSVGVPAKGNDFQGVTG